MSGRGRRLELALRWKSARRVKSRQDSQAAKRSVRERGPRDAGCANEFMTDLASRLTGRIQLTTDGHKAYLGAVADAFGADIDYAMLVKLYGKVPAGAARYSPPQCIGANLTPITGEPDMAHVSTSHVERQNLTLRMSMHRFTRLTNGFSRKVQNLEFAVTLHFMHYNFCRVHQTLRVTPAMAGGLSDHVWELSELIALVPKPVAKAWGSVKRANAATAWRCPLRSTRLRFSMCA
jgi:hypothetical protein